MPHTDAQLSCELSSVRDITHTTQQRWRKALVLSTEASATMHQPTDTHVLCTDTQTHAGCAAGCVSGALVRMLEELKPDYPDQVAETARAAASIAGGCVDKLVGQGVVCRGAGRFTSSEAGGWLVGWLGGWVGRYLCNPLATHAIPTIRLPSRLLTLTSTSPISSFPLHQVLVL
jgi:hypothetical protein